MIIPSHRRKMQTKRKYNIFRCQYALNIVSFFTLSFAIIMYQNILFHQGNKQTHNKRDRAKSLYKILDTEVLTKIQVLTAPLLPTLSRFPARLSSTLSSPKSYICVKWL